MWRREDKDVFNSVTIIQIMLGNMENLSQKYKIWRIILILTLSRERRAIHILKICYIVTVEYKMCNA